MQSITIHKQNEVYLYIMTSPGIEQELSEFFKFRVPGYQFMPKYRNRMWDGFLRLFNTFTKQLYLGLLPELKKFARDRGYNLDISSDFDIKNVPTKDDIETFTSNLILPKGITPYEYQINSIYECISNQRKLIVSPTGSGKSLNIYGLCRWYDNKRILIIVPTVNLVSQLESDFIEYAKKDRKYNIVNKCHKIHQGQSKETNKDIVISTWQSIYKQSKEYFNAFDVVIVDECHKAKAKSLTSIMEKTTEVKYKFGFTGTLNDAKTHKLTLQGLFGEVFQATTTATEIKNKRIAELKINCLIIKYSDEICKKSKNLKYQDEKKFLYSSKLRNKFIANLSLGMKSNALILYEHTKHGQEIYNLIKEKAAKNRKIFFVWGKTPIDEREEVRKITEKEKDAIIVAQVKVFSTGINIKNLEDVIFVSPSKAKIRTLQSIGRALRIGRSSKARLWDIVDDMSWKSYKNYALIHFTKRIEFYNQEKFPYKFYKIQLGEKIC